MSLKTFHVFFVALSALLAVGFGIWAIQESARVQQSSDRVLGIGSLMAAVLLVIYGVWFLRKLRRFSWL